MQRIKVLYFWACLLIGHNKAFAHSLETMGRGFLRLVEVSFLILIFGGCSKELPTQITPSSSCIWKVQYNDSSAHWFVDIDFVDLNHGWAVSNDGSIVYTTDGGQQWQKSSYVAPNSLTAVDFTDINNGWAVCMYGAIVRTTDGGITWQEQNSGTNLCLTDVFFINGQKGWAVGRGVQFQDTINIILSTSNGGNTWFVQRQSYEGPLQAVFFTDSCFGWAAGSYGNLSTQKGWVLHTSDGGANWVTQSNVYNASLYNIYFINPKYGWAVGTPGVILSTIDSGGQWNAINDSTQFFFTGVNFINQREGYVVGDRTTMDKPPLIKKTLNGGLNWTTDTVGLGAENFLSIQKCIFVDRYHGWASCAQGIILQYSPKQTGN